jgi:hypothetical protein
VFISITRRRIMGDRGISLLLTLSIDCRWAVSFRPRPLYPRGKSRLYPLDRRQATYYIVLRTAFVLHACYTIPWIEVSEDWSDVIGEWNIGGLLENTPYFNTEVFFFRLKCKFVSKFSGCPLPPRSAGADGYSRVVLHPPPPKERLPLYLMKGLVPGPMLPRVRTDYSQPLMLLYECTQRILVPQRHSGYEFAISRLCIE